MAEGKNRSAIFKFFYVVLRIVTFPIFMVLFILRHPLWILFLLLLIAGGAAYYPISLGVKPEKVLSWYQEKYIVVKKETVAKAKEKGMTDFVPQVLMDEVKQIEEDEAEALLPKGDNYNKKIVRDKKAEETKAMLKKRGGFKKQEKVDDEVKDKTDVSNEEGSVVNDEENTGDASLSANENKTDAVDKVDVLEQSGANVGGLSALLKKKSENTENPDEKNEVVPAENLNEKTDDNEVKEDKPETLEESIEVEVKTDSHDEAVKVDVNPVSIDVDIEPDAEDTADVKANTENASDVTIEVIEDENAVKESETQPEEKNEDDLELDIF